jgi:RNA polymerase sigma-70 factor (sigma-E family)
VKPDEDRSFDDFALSRGPALVRLAYLMVRDHHLAQDLAQECLARLHRHWPRVSVLDNPDAYARKVMLNQLLSWRRKRWWSERPVAEFRDTADPSQLHNDGPDREGIWVLLGTLPPRQRAVLALRYYEDLNDTEIAALLGCAPATVRVHASKALARLRSVVPEPHLASGGCRE